MCNESEWIVREAFLAYDRTYDVVTVRDGRIVELHACRDHAEARSLAGIG
jgi:ketosteroid isomerase-like protein